MKTLYLHIGAPKTGTTALQWFCYLNSSKLSDNGILYPDPGEGKCRINHFDFHKTNIRYAQGLIEFLEQCRDRSDTVLLSSEYFLFDLVNYNSVPVISKLHTFYDKIFVIVYLRRQDVWIESLYKQTLVFDKKRRTFHNFLSRYLANRTLYPPCDWYKSLMGLTCLFGKENLIVKTYEKHRFLNGNIYADFLDIFHLPLTPGYEIPDGDKLNLSIHPDLAEWYRMTNSFPFNFLQKIILKKVTIDESGEKARYFSLTEREDFIKSCSATNELVRVEFFPHNRQELFDFSCEAYRDNPVFRHMSRTEFFRQIPEILLSKKIKPGFIA